MCRLKKALYSLKQTPMTWYSRIDIFLSSLEFTKIKLDSNLQYKVENGNPVILLLYVDDLFVTGMGGLITNTKRKLDFKFEMKDLGMMHYFLGIEGWQNADGISLGQGKYAVEILKRFGMMDLLHCNHSFPIFLNFGAPPFLLKLLCFHLIHEGLVLL